MDVIYLFFMTFGLVFLSELGDKSQVVAFTSALHNQTKRLTIFLATSVSLTLIAGCTIYLTNFIPEKYLRITLVIGGICFILFGAYVLYKMKQPEKFEQNGVDLDKSHWVVFVRQFALVTACELGDKTQLLSFGLAAARPNDKLLIFVAAALALTTASGVAILATKLVPQKWIWHTKWISASLLIIIGIYLLVPLL